MNSVLFISIFALATSLILWVPALVTEDPQLSDALSKIAFAALAIFFIALIAGLAHSLT